MNINLEQTILRNLLTNEEYTRRVLPFLVPDYFEGVYKDLFKEVAKFVSKYNKIPTLESFKIEVDEGNRLSEENYRQAIEMLPNIFTAESENLDWLVERTEKWCQDRSVYNAVMESISIIDGKHATLQKNAIPDVLSKALGVAGTGVGKSLFMCHLASNILAQGRNVLYITMEMAEEKIAERIDANLLNIPIDQIENLSKDMFKDKVSQITAKTDGKLIIKEYPTGQANTSHFRALLNELKLKKNFIPEIIFVDYLNICASSRMKMIGGSINSYSYIKSIAEEMRGLAVEFNVPIMSATQTNRSGFTSDDPGLEDTSESFGLPATADLMFALISNEELNTMGKILVKQLKNRYNDPTKYNRFTLKVDRSKMRLADDDNQNVVVNNDDTPVFDKSTSGERVSSEKFKDFKWE